MTIDLNPSAGNSGIAVIIFAIPTSWSGFSVAWVGVETGVDRLWSLRAGAARVVDYSNPRLDRNDETHRLQRQRWKRGGLGWVKAAEQMVGAAIQLVADKSLTCPILSTSGTGVSGPQGRFAWLLRRYRKSAVTSRSLGLKAVDLVVNRDGSRSRIPTSLWGQVAGFVREF